MKKLMFICVIMAIASYAQNEKWSCHVKNKKLTRDNVQKTWNMESDRFVQQDGDTLMTIDMSTGKISVFSFTTSSVKKRCEMYGLSYGRVDNFCEGYLSKETFKHLMPSIINKMLDTMSTKSVIELFTEKNTAIEQLDIVNGYGERTMGDGSHTAFQLEIKQDDRYWFKAENNSLFVSADIVIDKKMKSYKMVINAAAVLKLFIELDGPCVIVE